MLGAAGCGPPGRPAALLSPGSLRTERAISRRTLLQQASMGDVVQAEVNGWASARPARRGSERGGAGRRIVRRLDRPSGGRHPARATSGGAVMNHRSPWGPSLTIVVEQHALAHRATAVLGCRAASGCAGPGGGLHFRRRSAQHSMRAGSSVDAPAFRGTDVADDFFVQEILVMGPRTRVTDNAQSPRCEAECVGSMQAGSRPSARPTPAGPGLEAAGDPGLTMAMAQRPGRWACPPLKAPARSLGRARWPAPGRRRRAGTGGRAGEAAGGRQRCRRGARAPGPCPRRRRRSRR